MISYFLRMNVVKYYLVFCSCCNEVGKTNVTQFAWGQTNVWYMFHPAGAGYCE